MDKDDDSMMCLSNSQDYAPKRRYWKAEQSFPNASSTQFSTIRRKNQVPTPLKRAQKTHSEKLVRPSHDESMTLWNMYATQWQWTHVGNNISEK